MSFESDTPIYTGTVTTNEYGVPTPQPQPKVVAATAGASVGAACATLVIWGVESIAAIDIPVAAEGAILVLLTAVVSFVAGYIKRPSITAS